MSGAGTSVEAIWREIGEEHSLLKSHLYALISECSKLSGSEGCCHCSAVKTTGCADRALQHVGELLAYIVTHFHNEERVMRQWNLPASNFALFEEHIQDHARLSEGFSQLASEIDDQNPLPQLKKLHALMETWLRSHILVHDKRLLEELGATGIESY